MRATPRSRGRSARCRRRSRSCRRKPRSRASTSRRTRRSATSPRRRSASTTRWAIIAALRQRFTDIVGPDAATSAMRRRTGNGRCANSARRSTSCLSSGRRTARIPTGCARSPCRWACRAYLIADSSEIRPEWIEDVNSVGVTAGASAPEELVAEVIRRLASLRPVEISNSQRP